MTDPEIKVQQEREYAEPIEGSNPMPLAVILVIACLFVFGIYYTHYAKDIPAQWGDMRTLEELSAKSTSGGADGKVDGKGLYASLCVACHQATGAGLPGVFPPLADSDWVLGKAETLAAIVLHGVHGPLTVNDVQYDGDMPAFGDQLDDAEIAAVLTHIRSDWGNSADAVDAELVAQVRQDTASQTEQWHGDEDLQDMK